MKKILITLILVGTCFGVSPSITNFNGGQVTPLLEARIDFAKYASSCRKQENMFASVRGMAIKRPGTRYVGTVSTPSFTPTCSYDYPTLRALGAGEYPTLPTEPTDIELSNPTHIINQAGLAAITGNNHYILDNDITLTGSWTPITTFAGVLDGNGYNITGLNINLLTTDDVGMFKQLGANAQIRNLEFVNAVVNGDDRVGVLAGKIAVASVSVKIKNVIVTNCAVAGTTRTGGLVGYTENPATAPYIMNCTSSGTVTIDGLWSVGGLIGLFGVNGNETTNGVVINCSSSCTVTCTYSPASGFQKIGGLIGDIASGYVVNSYATGAVTGYAAHKEMGGFVGQTAYGHVINCHATGNVTGGQSCGGFVGQDDGFTEFLRCYATGTVNGITSGSYDIAGGFVGYNGSGISTFKRCYSTGNVSGVKGESLGGFAGEINEACTLENCYTWGSVSSLLLGNNANLSGFMGRAYNNNIIITNCYSIGAVDISSSNYSGGFVENSFGIVLSGVTSSYWDTDTSGWATSDNGAGKTTTLMKTPATYVGWDMDTIWSMPCE